MEWKGQRQKTGSEDIRHYPVQEIDRYIDIRRHRANYDDPGMIILLCFLRYHAGQNRDAYPKDNVLNEHSLSRMPSPLPDYKAYSSPGTTNPE